MGEVRLSEIICDGYEEYWRSHKFYRVIKGSKGSGKSKTAALWHIHHMMKYPMSNTLVVRKVYGTLRDSTYTDLLWAIDRLGVTRYWTHTTNPLRITFKRNPDDESTWQEIHFRGLDDSQKIASIAVRCGYLNWVWFEEASEMTNYDDFERVVMSIRGYLDPQYHLWKSVTITFNPWSDKHWLKSRFFDTPHKNVLAMTTTYRCNRWLGPDDLERYHEMERDCPRLARIVCDGDWGVSEGLVYEDWEEQDFDILEVAKQYPKLKFTFGLDFGFSISYNAFVAVAVDMDSRKLWIFDEMYERGMPNFEIAKRITEMGYQNETIIADCADPKSIYELKMGFKELIVDDAGDMIPDERGQPQYKYYVLPNIRSAMKGSDSLKNGIQRVQSFHMIVHATKCKNVMMELSQYCYDQDKDGKFLDRPIKEADHCLVAGTMVLTDHGEVPIEDVKVGDMVLTHLGYREVLASGITRPEPARIWRMTLEDGTILEGTADHPLTTIDGLKYIFEITEGMEVIQCVPTPVIAEANARRQNVSNMMDTHGTDTLTATRETRECITGTQEILMEKNTSIDMSGSNTTGLSPRDISYTTSTGTPSTMTSPISPVCLLQNMHRNTPGLMREGQKEEIQCVGTLGSRTNAESGMLQRKDTSGMSSMENRLQRTCNQRTTSANTAGSSSHANHSVPISIVPTHANQLLEERRGSTTLNLFVNAVAKPLSGTNTTSPNVAVDPVQTLIELTKNTIAIKPIKVVSVEETTRFEFVYDLTVDEAHTFFANDILVLNCMDSIRYGMEGIFGSGTGMVIEAGLDDPVEVMSPTRNKCRRVFSTYD